VGLGQRFTEAVRQAYKKKEFLNVSSGDLRPHSKLGYQSPVRYAQQLTPSPAPVGLRPLYAGDGQTQTNNLTIENNLSD
jgi:hypothetical protein